MSEQISRRMIQSKSPVEVFCQDKPRPSSLHQRCCGVISSAFRPASNWVMLLLCALERRLLAAALEVGCGWSRFKITFWVMRILKKETLSLSMVLKWQLSFSPLMREDFVLHALSSSSAWTQISCSDVNFFAVLLGQWGHDSACPNSSASAGS